MTPPSDDQTGNKSETPDFDQTVPLKRCNKHGVTYLETEGCPECEKEKQQAAEKK